MSVEDGILTVLDRIEKQARSETPENKLKRALEQRGSLTDDLKADKGEKMQETTLCGRVKNALKTVKRANDSLIKKVGRIAYYSMVVVMGVSGFGGGSAYIMARYHPNAARTAVKCIDQAANGLVDTANNYIDNEQVKLKEYEERQRLEKLEELGGVPKEEFIKEKENSVRLRIDKHRLSQDKGVVEYYRKFWEDRSNHWQSEYDALRGQLK